MLLSFPHMGKLYLAVEKTCQKLNIPCLIPEPPGPAALKLGQELAPEGSCLPFCLVLGNMRQALEKGADSIVMLGGSGPCRFGFFVYLAIKILKDAGYSFDPLIIDKGYHFDNFKRLQKEHKVTVPAFLAAASFGWSVVVCEEILSRLEREYRPLVLDQPGFDSFIAGSRELLLHTSSQHEVAMLRRSLSEYQKRLPIAPQQDRILSIGLIGDIYTLLEPYANHRIEEYLRSRGIVVYKEMSVSGWLPNILLPWRKGGYRRSLLQQAYPYLRYGVGGFGLESVANAQRMRKRQVDGIIQLFPLGCMPEIVARSALDRICREENIPIMCVTLDQHDSMTGFETRLEAFLDVVANKKEERREKAGYFTVTS